MTVKNRALWHALLSIVLVAVTVTCRDATPVSPAIDSRRGGKDVLGPPDVLPPDMYVESNLIADSPELEGTFVKDIAIVIFQPTASQEDRSAAVASVGGEIVGGSAFLDGDGAYLVRIPSDSTGHLLLQAVDSLNRRPEVDAASPEMLADIDSTEDYLRPNDAVIRNSWRIDPQTAHGSQWAFERIGAPSAWGCSVGDAGTKVAILDVSFWNLEDYHNNIPFTKPAAWTTSGTDRHGTAVASILSAEGDNGIGMAGMMWHSALSLRRRTEHSVDESRITTLSDLALIAQESMWGARVINISGSLDRIGPRAPSSDTAAAYNKIRFFTRMTAATLRGLGRLGRHPLLVVSAGNRGHGPDDTWWNGFPALADSVPDQVMVVAASDQNDQLRSDSRFGRLVTIAAPGENVLALNQLGDTAGFNQTSAATPLVAGAAGLLFSFDASLTPARVKQLLIDGAVRGNRVTSGNGNYPILNIYESLKLAAESQGAPLCGNHVWIANRQVVAQRGTGTEVLADLDPSSYGAYLNLKHGGHRFEVDYGTAFVFNGSTRHWDQVNDNGDPSTLDGAMFSSYNGSSHDGDVWVGAQSSTNSSTHEKSIVVSAYDSTGSRILTTMHFGYTVAALQCGRKIGTDVLVGDGWFTIRGPYICEDSTALGPWSEVGHVTPYPFIAPDGNSLLIPIDTWADTATGGGPFVECDSVSQNDTNNLPLEICLSSTITRKLIRTDVYEIPLHGTVPANLESNPKWTIANRGIYWMALSEDNKEFGAGFLTLSSTITGGTGSGSSGSTAAMNCTNEYRSSFSGTQAFGTFLSATPSDAPNGEPSCWVDAGSGVSSIRSALSLRIAGPSMASGQPQTLPSSRRGPSGRQINPVRPLKREGRALLPISPAYVVPGGLWSIDERGIPHIRSSRKIARRQVGN